MKTGIIYKSTSPSGKVYIGQTTQGLHVRRNNHFSKAFNENCTVYNTKFSRAIRKYRDKLIWDILYDNIPAHYLSYMEITVIGQYNSYKIGYNSTLGGGCVDVIVSEGTKRKLSEAGFL